MNMQMLVQIELFCVFQMMKSFILTVLELNMFLKKLENLLDIKALKQRYLEYKEAIQWCVDIFTLD